MSRIVWPYVYSLCSPNPTASPMLSLNTSFEYPHTSLSSATRRRPEDVGDHVSQSPGLSAHRG
ncbi:hypothetical protein FIBSPDRAFT_851991 [Athelia psychrophila]|uniref:Uncharacterized protein n=1 Tax=Athelia psychrophila TaxID=1759441 RepID=A0A166S8A0_9AGAM|nr:hypothetical protein FIBSPDRAFT_851991 [Fibularhizoctonia sp. CBS 109695]